MKIAEKEAIKAVVIRTIKQTVVGISDKDIKRVLMSLYIDLAGRKGKEKSNAL